jgi:tetratricopeptide (TPR) repeat protein
MLKDRYDNLLATNSANARDLYVEAMDMLLGAAPGIVGAFDKVVKADPGFAQGHCGLARARMISGDMAGAGQAMQQAVALADGLTNQQTSHINVIRLLVEGKAKDAYRATREHVADYPRDALVAQLCTSIFGLIGFSNQPGREAELLAYTAGLLPHYGEDWWLLSQHAFSLCEVGQLEKASTMIDMSLALNPRNGHAAHVRSHIYYEVGEAQVGIDYLQDWLGDYDRSGLLHGHLSWHVSLWAMEQGDGDLMWRVFDRDVMPGASQGVPLNVLTDSASFLYRASLAGEDIPAHRWKSISDYAEKFFPKTANAFVDVHAALAHAMAGNNQALQRIISQPAGLASDLVRQFGKAFAAIANQNWPEATAHLTKAMADHARIGGSRAQRDLLELTLLGLLLKQGHTQEARRILALRRPVLATSVPFGNAKRSGSVSARKKAVKLC